MSESTREVLRRTALRLFTERGYDAVTVAQVAAAAGTSHMTFFRHFPSKESVVVADLFDPVIAAAVAARPVTKPPLERAVRGLLAALDGEEARAELASEEFRQRVALCASTPSLRGAVHAATAATEDAVADALTAPGTPALAARAAAAALLGASTSLLLAWATSPGGEPVTVLRDGLLALLGESE